MIKMFFFIYETGHFKYPTSFVVTPFAKKIAPLLSCHRNVETDMENISYSGPKSDKKNCKKFYNFYTADICFFSLYLSKHSISNACFLVEITP